MIDPCIRNRGRVLKGIPLPGSRYVHIQVDKLNDFRYSIPSRGLLAAAAALGLGGAVSGPRGGLGGPGCPISRRGKPPRWGLQSYVES